MKVFSKLWSLLLVAAILCPMISLMPVSAAGTGSPTASDTLTVSTEMQTVRVDFYMTAAEGIEDFEGYVQYDPEYLSYAGDSDVLVDASVAGFEKNGNISGYFYFCASTATEGGMDFSTKIRAFSVLFNVVKSGETTVSSAITYSYGASGAPLVDDLININRGVIDTAVAAHSLRIKSVTLSLETDLDVNFYVLPQCIEGYSNVYLKLNGSVGTVRINKPSAVESSGSHAGQYKFTYSGLNPMAVGKDLNPTLYGTRNGVEYSSKPMSYSVVSYCKNQFTKIANKATLTDRDIKFRTMLVDLLNYATTVQVKYDYTDEAAANSFLTDAQKAWATPDVDTLQSVTNVNYAVIDDPQVVLKAASLLLEGRIEVNIKYELSGISDLSGLSVLVTDADGETVYSTSRLSDTLTNGRYTVSFSLRADQMTMPVYIKFMKNGSAVSNTLQYSVESYAASKYKAPGAEGVTEDQRKLSDLVAAMIMYGRSVESYIASA